MNKPRKTVSGPIRDKERTKQKLLKTVGKIIQTKGFHHLKITKIAEAAGLDKKLIYEYFGSVENLVNEYLRTQDLGTNLQQAGETPETVDDFGKQISKNMISNMFETLSTNKELQKIIVWELSEYHEILRKLADRREEIGEQLFEKFMQPYFKGNNKKYRAVLAILISASYYLNLHADANGSLFCGLDVRKPEDRKAVEDAMDDFIDMAYEKYGK